MENNNLHTIKTSVVFTNEDGQHMILLPDGTELQGVIFTRVHDGFNEPPTVIIKAFCRLAGNRDDALKLIDK